MPKKTLPAARSRLAVAAPGTGRATKSRVRTAQLNQLLGCSCFISIRLVSETTDGSYPCGIPGSARPSPVIGLITASFTLRLDQNCLWRSELSSGQRKPRSSIRNGMPKLAR